jgi:hypothetical protein
LTVGSLWRRASAPARAADADAVAAPSFEPLEHFQQRPVAFVLDVLGGFPWAAQREILEAAVDDPLIAVRGGKGWGKTRTLAWLMLWNFFCWPNTLGLTTATSWTQVRTQVWKEIHYWLQRARQPLPCRRMDTRLELGPRWYLMGLSTKKPESMAGFHAETGLTVGQLPLEVLERLTDDQFFGGVLQRLGPDIAAALGQLGAPLPAGTGEVAPGELLPQVVVPGRLVVGVDEASATDPKIDSAIDGLATTPGSRIYRFCNPTRNDGRMWEIFHPGAVGRPDEDTRPHVPGRDQLRFTVDARRAPPQIVDPEHIARLIAKCPGDPETDPDFMVNVKGQHATTSEMSVYPLALLVRASRSRPKFGGLHLGVDIGRQGSDPSVAVLVDDGTVCGIKSWGGEGGALMDFARSALIVKTLAEGWGVEAQNVHIDVTGGWGWGVYDILLNYHRFAADPVDYGSAPKLDWSDTLGASVPLLNRRQELHWIALRCLQEGFLCVPQTPAYAGIWADFLAIRRHPAPKGLRGDAAPWQVEAKEDFKARTGRSCNCSDATITALSRTGSIVPAFAALG